MGNYTNDYTRLSPQTREKFKNSDEEAYNLINRPKKIQEVFNDCRWNFISCFIEINNPLWIVLSMNFYMAKVFFCKDNINSLNLMHNSTFILEKMEYKRIDINQTNTCSINFFLNVIGFKILLILLIWHILEKIYGE